MAFQGAPLNRIGAYGQGNMYEVLYKKIDAASAIHNVIVPEVSGKKIRVLGIKLSVADAVTITWKTGSPDGGVALGAAESYAANGGMSDYWGPWGYFFETNEGESLGMTLSAAVQVSGWLNYILI